jgi:hypothetical protein
VGLTYVSVTIGIVIAVACAWYCRRLALEKRRNVLLWTILGFVLTVVAVPVLVLLPATSSGSEFEPVGPEPPETPAGTDDTK